MRGQSIQELAAYDPCTCVAGDAANTTLKSNSVDFITAAQAFHWFDAASFKRECKRILKHHGKVFLIWNVRDMEPEITRKSYEIYQKFCPNFKGFSGGIKRDDDRIKFFFDGEYERVEYDHPLYYSKEKFLNRSLSGSYSLKQEDADYEEYIGALGILFDEYAINGTVTLPNKTVAYIGAVR